MCNISGLAVRDNLLYRLVQVLGMSADTIFYPD